MNFDKVGNQGETNIIVKDISQYNNTGTAYNGAAWTGNGKRNGAYNFDGIDDYVSVPDSTRFTLTNNYTVSAWINPNDIANQAKGIM